MSRESGVHLSRAPTPLSISLFICFFFFFFYWFLLCCLLHSSHPSFLFLIFSPLPYACISLVYTHISLYASLLVTLFPNSFCQRERERDCCSFNMTKSATFLLCKCQLLTRSMPKYNSYDRWIGCMKKN